MDCFASLAMTAATKAGGHGSWLFARTTKHLILDPIPVQIVAVRIEPPLGALYRRADPRHHLPEPRRVVHLDEMRHFVGGEIVEHEGRREDQAPGERQRAGRRAGTPAARLIAD